MLQEYLNVYQSARTSSGLTQERAAELIGVSVESVRAYEGGGRIPTDETVIRMVEIYGTQFLAYQHLRSKSEIARTYMPDIRPKDIPAAILSVLKEINDLLACRDDLISIGCDGKISQDELGRWNGIMKEFDDAKKAIMTIELLK